MFESPEPLTAEKHAGLRLNRQRDYGFARQEKAVPIALSEAPPAAGDMPLVFSGGEVPNLLAVLSLDENPSPFVDAQGHWRGRYIPAMLRRYPLAMASGQQEGQAVVIIDPDAPELQDPQGEPLFGEDGQRSAILEERIQLLQAIHREREKDAVMIRSIVDSGVLTPQEVTVGEGESRQTLAQGFQVVTREKLNALDDATLADWARRGLLRAIEAHLESLRHLQTLAQAALSTAG